VSERGPSLARDFKVLRLMATWRQRALPAPRRPPN